MAGEGSEATRPENGARPRTPVGSGPRGCHSTLGGRPDRELPEWSRSSLSVPMSALFATTTRRSCVLAVTGLLALAPLRFGIGPLPQAGQASGGPATALPEQPARTDAALARLRAPGRPFVLRLNRFFWSDGEAGFRRYLGLARRFARQGYLIELQVRYHPDAAQEGHLAAWRDHVREVVRRFGRIHDVIALQIANEVNLTFSADSSDGAYRRAPQALVQGVIAARREARRLRLRRLKIGFNWFCCLGSESDQRFWNALRDSGGRRFAA